MFDYQVEHWIPFNAGLIANSWWLMSRSSNDQNQKHYFMTPSLWIMILILLDSKTPGNQPHLGEWILFFMRFCDQYLSVDQKNKKTPAPTSHQCPNHANPRSKVLRLVVLWSWKIPVRLRWTSSLKMVPQRSNDTLKGSWWWPRVFAVWVYTNHLKVEHREPHQIFRLSFPRKL